MPTRIQISPAAIRTGTDLRSWNRSSAIESAYAAMKVRSAAIPSQWPAKLTVCTVLDPRKYGTDCGKEGRWTSPHTDKTRPVHAQVTAPEERAFGWVACGALGIRRAGMRAANLGPVF